MKYTVSFKKSFEYNCLSLTDEKPWKLGPNQQDAVNGKKNQECQTQQIEDTSPQKMVSTIKLSAEIATPTKLLQKNRHDLFPC